MPVKFCTRHRRVRPVLVTFVRNGCNPQAEQDSSALRAEIKALSDSYLHERHQLGNLSVCQNLRMLDHPNVVRLYEVNEDAEATDLE